MEPHAPRPETFSLAKTFAPFRHRGPRVNRHTKALRVLAKCGAMTPEGCSARLLHHVHESHGVAVADIKSMLGTLWNARLLGWHPMDTEWLTFERVREIVEHGTHRPADVHDIMPVGFKRAVGKPPRLDAYRFAPA